MKKTPVSEEQTKNEIEIVEAEARHRHEALSITLAYCKLKDRPNPDPGLKPGVPTPLERTQDALSYFQNTWGYSEQQTPAPEAKTLQEFLAVQPDHSFTFALNPITRKAPSHSVIRDSELLGVNLKLIDGKVAIFINKNGTETPVDCNKLKARDLSGTPLDGDPHDILLQKHPSVATRGRQNAQMESIKNAVCYRYRSRNLYGPGAALSWDLAFAEYFGNSWEYKTTTPDNKVDDLISFLEQKNTLTIKTKNEDPNLPSRPHLVISRDRKTTIQKYSGIEPAGEAMRCNEEQGTVSDANPMMMADTRPTKNVV